MSRITEELEARIRRASEKDNQYYLVAQHNHEYDLSYIINVGKDLYEFAYNEKSVVSVFGVDEAKFSLSEINQETYDLIQSLDVIGVLIRAELYNSHFIFSRFQHLSLPELKERLALLGDEAKYEIVLANITHNGQPDHLDLSATLGRLHYEYNINK
ncbi:MAG: hypothetical protein ABS904_00600 [Solibacillus isronensis]